MKVLSHVTSFITDGNDKHKYFRGKTDKEILAMNGVSHLLFIKQNHTVVKNDCCSNNSPHPRPPEEATLPYWDTGFPHTICLPGRMLIHDICNLYNEFVHLALVSCATDLCSPRLRDAGGRKWPADSLAESSSPES